ncbi:MAG: phage holin family protein [Pirellulales bacterium]
MDEQTTLNGKAHPARDLKEHLLDMTRDAGRIAELQSRLLMAEWRRAKGRMLAAAGLGAAAVVLTAAALPVTIGGVGMLLAETTELSVAGGLLCAAAGTVVLSGVLLASGWYQLRRQAAAWERSKIELRESAQTLRTAMAQAFARADRSDDESYEP